jgi:hypothetical protein
MRGIVWEDVRHVRLVKPTHPEVLTYQQKLAYRTTVQLDAKFHEREQERHAVSSLLGEPFERLTTQDEMLDAFIAHIYQAPPLPQLPPATCRDCRHCAPDRYHPGSFVCWQGWTAGRPKALTTMQPCPALTDTRQPPSAPSRWEIHHDMTEFLALHGIRYNGSRWKAHRNDLAREAGDWGFQVGTQWEQDVRAWLTGCYGEDFFSPYRWLIIDTRSGAKLFREVDGIERLNEHQAFVYEIKHHTSGYVQLTKEYIPLLRRAFPERMFTPIEINVGDPYGSLLERISVPIRRLRSLEERTMDGQYQLFVLPTIPEEDRGFDRLASLDYLQDLRCRQCGGELWESPAEMRDYLDLTCASGVPQNPFDVCSVVDQIHSRRGVCVSCASAIGLA